MFSSLIFITTVTGKGQVHDKPPPQPAATHPHRRDFSLASPSPPPSPSPRYLISKLSSRTRTSLQNWYLLAGGVSARIKGQLFFLPEGSFCQDDEREPDGIECASSFLPSMPATAVTEVREDRERTNFAETIIWVTKRAFLRYFSLRTWRKGH